MLDNLQISGELLRQESISRGESHRLIVNLNNDSYRVLREVPRQPGESTEVDYLKNLRTRKEQERREVEEEEEQLLSLEDEFVEEDLRQSGALDVLYYQAVFRDPLADVRLAVPLQFPTLAKWKKLSAGLSFRDIVINGEKFTDGRAEIRFSSQHVAQLAVIHFSSGDAIFTLAVKPESGSVEVYGKDVSYNDAIGDWDSNSLGN